jgi:hypothetical protein
LNPAWISLWPAIQQDSEGFEDVTVVDKEFVSLENQWGSRWTRMMWKTLFSLTVGSSPLRIYKIG